MRTRALHAACKSVIDGQVFKDVRIPNMLGIATAILPPLSGGTLFDIHVWNAHDGADGLMGSPRFSRSVCPR